MTRRRPPTRWVDEAETGRRFLDVSARELQQLLADLPSPHPDEAFAAALVTRLILEPEYAASHPTGKARTLLLEPLEVSVREKGDAVTIRCAGLLDAIGTVAVIDALELALDKRPHLVHLDCTGLSKALGVPILLRRAAAACRRLGVRLDVTTSPAWIAAASRPAAESVPVA